MTATSLRKNYEMLAINEKRMEPEKSGRVAGGRVMLKEAGQAFLKTHEAQVVYGEKITR